MKTKNVFLFAVLVLAADSVNGRAPIQGSIGISNESEEVPFEIEEPEPVLKNVEYQDESNATNVETAVNEETVVNAETAVDAEIIAENVTKTTNDVEPSLRVSYVGNQLWKTFVGTTEELRVISNLKREKDISTWGGNHSCVDILVKPESLEKVSNALSKGNIKYEIVIKDLQKAIDEENPPVSEETNDRKGYRLTWKAYHGWTDIHSYLDYVAETYPDLCTLKTIGQSVEGKPIKVLKISNGQPSNKAVWIDGGIHAREWISPATATYLINHLVSNLENEPPYMREIDWYFAPLLNPDGYEYSHKVDRLWRKNRGGGGVGSCRGTDLNRNFGYRWGGQGSSKNPCSDTYGGSGPFSEPETAAVKRFITSTPAKWKAYISLHSYGHYILHPWGYARVVPADYRDLSAVGKMAAAAILKAGGPAYTVGPAGNTLYPAAGGSDDWAKGAVGMKYAYTIELRDDGRYGFVLPASYISPTAKEALAAVRVIAEAAQKA